MHPCATKFTINIKQEPSDVNRFHAPPGGCKTKDINRQNVIELSSSDSEDENTLSCDDSHKQLVLYEPSINEEFPIESFPNPISYKLSPFTRILPSVGDFTVQCANCFKWRIIPSQEKYEEIREHITETPFVCETACEWRPDISCNDPTDIEQDGSRLWAIDKPDIAQPPPGWQRDLRIRGEGSTKFGDIYYTSPTGAKLRSMPDIEKYLFKYPEYVEQGVTLTQFSFLTPKPLQENYVRKRPSRAAQLQGQDGNFVDMPGSFGPSPEKPLALPGPDQTTDLRLGMPGFDHLNPSPKKARTGTGKPRHNFDLMYKHHEM